jgi:hypothetical protein
MPISIVAEPEPEPTGASSFWWSQNRSCNWMLVFPHPNIDNQPILSIIFGAGAVRSIIILVESEPETQQDAAQAPAPMAPAPMAPAPMALAPTAPAPHLMFNIGGLSKNVIHKTVSYFSYSLS